MSRIRRPNREYAIEKLRALISAGLGEEDEAILQKLESSSDDSSVASQEGAPDEDDNNNEDTSKNKADNSATSKTAVKTKKKKGSDDDSDYSIKSDAYGQQDDSDVDSSFDNTEDSKELISSSDGEDTHGKKKKSKKASKAEKEAQRQIRNENREGKEKRKGDSTSKKGGTLGEVRLRNATKVFTHVQRMEMALTRAKEQTILLRKMEEDASAAIANDEATAADLMALSSKKGRATRKAVKKKVKGGKRGRDGKKKGGGGGSDSNESEGGNEDSKVDQSAVICGDVCNGGFFGGGAGQALIGLSQTRLGVVNDMGKGLMMQPTYASQIQLHLPSGSSSDLISDHNFDCSDTPSFTFEERRRLGLNTVREHRKLINRRRQRNRKLQEGGAGTQLFSSTRTFPLVAV